MHWLAIVLLVILASVGIGISGAVPVQQTSKKEERAEIKNELVESKHDITDSEQFANKQ